MSYSEHFMERAAALSMEAIKEGKGLPIGCVIVKDGVVIGEGHNEIFLRTNPTAHGEMVAIEAACQNVKSLDLSGCELYTTLEPCPMCMAAIYWSKVSRVYYANSNEDAVRVGFSDTFIEKELLLPKQERKILTQKVKSKIAELALENWKLMNVSVAQPWT